MQSYPILLKIVVLSSFILLMTSLVAYRSGSFDTVFGKVEYEQGDSTIPDSLLPPKFIHSSKSMAPIFKETPKITPLDSPIIKTIKDKDDEMRAASSKSGRVFSGDDFYIEDVRILKLDPADSIKPKKKKKKRKKRKRKQMMSGSKSAAVISPE